MLVIQEQASLSRNTPSQENERTSPDVSSWGINNWSGILDRNNAWFFPTLIKVLHKREFDRIWTRRLVFVMLSN